MDSAAEQVVVGMRELAHCRGRKPYFWKDWILRGGGISPGPRVAVVLSVHGGPSGCAIELHSEGNRGC